MKTNQGSQWRIWNFRTEAWKSWIYDSKSQNILRKCSRCVLICWPVGFFWGLSFKFELEFDNVWEGFGFKWWRIQKNLWKCPGILDFHGFMLGFWDLWLVLTMFSVWVFIHSPQQVESRNRTILLFLWQFQTPVRPSTLFLCWNCSHCLSCPQHFYFLMEVAFYLTVSTIARKRQERRNVWSHHLFNPPPETWDTKTKQRICNNLNKKFPDDSSGYHWESE